MDNLKIDRAFCLPEAEIQLLQSGRSISTLPRTLIESHWSFALYSPNSLSIQAVAVCQWCRILESDDLPRLAEATHWSREDLEQKAQQQPYIFLAALRIVPLPTPIALSTAIAQEEKLGRFVALPEVQQLTDPKPVLGDRLFALRAHQLNNLEPESNTQLQVLQQELDALDSPTARAIAAEARAFLGWSEHPASSLTPSQDWISSITTVGNSSDGHLFEKLVRRGFIHLGFSNSLNDAKASLDPDATGGAGGIDFFCDSPYFVVGECKASGTEKVPDSTPAQLVKLGLKILPQAVYESSIKIIMAAGKLTAAADQTAIGNKMNVLRPETLQRLVELKDAYPGAVDLLQLKPCLEQEPLGEAADQKVNNFINDSYRKIDIRAHIVAVIKKQLEDPNVKSAGIQDLDELTAFNLYVSSSPPDSLTLEEFKMLLIELASPLVGYLGRTSANRYYFLRSLIVDDKLKLH